MRETVVLRGIGMKNIFALIAKLESRGYFRPESVLVLKGTLMRLSLSWDVDEKNIKRFMTEIYQADTSHMILHEDDLHGKFLYLAPDLAARMTIEQVRCSRQDYYEQSQRVFNLYVKLCERYHFDRGSC